MVTAVGFDLDYTLAVPERDRSSILADAVASVGAPEISRDAYLDAHREHLTAETRAPIFDALLPADADASAEELARAYRTGVERALVPVAGAADLVRRLRADYRVGLLTDGPVRAQRGKLERLGWTDLFDAVVVTGALPAGKPDARTFAALLSALDATPERAVYVGDHPVADVRGALDAGLHAVQVVYEGGPDPVPAADAVVERDRLVSTLPAVLASVDG